LADKQSIGWSGQNKLLLSPLVILFLFAVSSSCTSRQTYTEETTNGLKHIHNIEPFWGTEEKVALEFVRKIGDLNTADERYQLYRPADVAVDAEGNILILDSGNYQVKKFDNSGRYLSSFGKKGSGPGEFLGATKLDVCPDGDILINDLAIRVVNVFNSSGRFSRRFSIEGLSPTQVLALRSGEIAVFHVSTSPSENKGQTPSLISVFDKDGTILRKFAAARFYEDVPTNFWCNSAAIARDDNDAIYVNFESQNRIEKYSAEGHLLFKVDRLLGYPETVAIGKEVHVYDEGPLVAVSFNIFSAGIQIDHEGRIWSGTLKRQKDRENKKNSGQARREGGRPENYMLEIYDNNGILLERLQREFYHGQRFRIAGDRFFLVDRDVEMSVFEYKIVNIN
jgi:hypothetical protein